MASARKLRQRKKRHLVEQIRQELINQSKNISSEVSLPRNIYIDTTFANYTIEETKKDLETLEDERVEVVEKALQLLKESRKVYAV